MTLREFPNIGEKLYTETLPNGLIINVLPKPGYTKTYAFFVTNYGGADRRFRLADQWIDTPAGVAHFLEHKMFDTPEGGNALAVLSANGASPNAYTSSGKTAYHFSCTRGFEENLETLLSFVTVPHFTDESVMKEQGIIGQEIRMMEDNPGYVVYQNLLRCLYQHNPVRDSIAGTIESIAEISAQTLYDCHKVFYNPSNMVLCVAGDVDAAKIADIAARIVPSEPGAMPERDYGAPEDDYPTNTLTSAQMEVSAPLFIIGARAVPKVGGVQLLRQRLLSSLALESLAGRSSSFYARLYADGLLNKTFGFEMDFTAGTAMAMFEGESAQPERILKELSLEVKSVSANGLDSEYFSRQKKALYGNRLRGLNVFEAQCRSLADGAFSGYCPLESFELLEEITADEASSFIADTLNDAKLAMSIVAPNTQP